MLEAESELKSVSTAASLQGTRPLFYNIETIISLYCESLVAVLGNESFHHLALLTVKLLKNEPFIGRNYLHKSEYTGMPFLSLWTSGASEIALPSPS